MSLKAARKDPRARNQQRFLVFIGVIMIASMVLSTLMPLFQNVLNAASVIVPTASPAPTVPAPISNLSTITFTETYLHPSGLYTIRVPSGWIPGTTSTTDAEAQVTMKNDAQLSVAEVRLLKPTTPVAGVNDLGAIFTETWLNSSWREYSSPKESLRKIEGDRLIIDFTLQRSGQEYIARQLAYTDGTYVYVSRVVTPPNAAEMLVYVLEELTKTITVLPEFAGDTFGWNAYFDASAHHIIRFPRSWQVVDSAPGLPASIQGLNSALRVETLEGVVNTEDEAKARVEGLRAGITVLSTKVLERDGFKGFQVAYRLVNQDGDAESGAAVLLNGPDGKIHLASLRLTNVPDVDLNSDPGIQTQGEAVNVLNSFTLLPSLQIAIPTATPTPGA